MAEGFNKLVNYFNKKRNLYIMLLIGILILISVNLFSDSEKEHQQITKNSETIYSQNEEQRLEEILSKVSGAGRVDVMITYETGTEKVALQNTKINKTINNSFADKNNEDITEISEEKETVMNGSGSGQTPFIIKETTPKVRGVLVVAEGGGNKNVQYEITNAVAAVLNVPYYRIQVLQKSK